MLQVPFEQVTFFEGRAARVVMAFALRRSYFFVIGFLLELLIFIRFRILLEESGNRDPVRAINGVFAAFIAWIGFGVGFATLARSAAGKAKAFRPVVGLLKFFHGEAIAGGFGGHVFSSFHNK
jgi:hypothetical protein